MFVVCVHGNDAQEVAAAADALLLFFLNENVIGKSFRSSVQSKPSSVQSCG